MQNTVKAVFASPDFTDFLFNKLDIAVFLVDRDFNVRTVNNSFRYLFGDPSGAKKSVLCGEALGCEFALSQGKPCGFNQECPSCSLRKNIASNFANEGETLSTRISRSFFIDGAPMLKHLEITSKRLDIDGNAIVVVAIRDITETERLRELSAEITNRDMLTGLANRQYFFDIGENLFQNAKRGNINISVAIFDIDFFKRINDTWGHAAGDYVIREISGILVANLRKADIVSRFGGEEFGILLHCKDPEDAYSVVDKLRLFVEQHVFLFEGKKIAVTISAGLTSALTDSLDSMAQKAGEMLGKAKKGGRNRTEEFSGK